MKDILRGIVNVYSETIIEVQNQDLSTDKSNHRFMSSKFVLNVANKIKDIINGEDIHVFSRYVENYNDFKLSEYLYDIHVCKMNKFKSVNNHEVNYVEKSLVQIESEFSNNSKDVSADFSKLVCGNADLKVMIVKRVQNEESFRNSFLDIAKNISGKLYLIQLEHPENWRECSPLHYKVFEYNNKWEVVEL